MKQTQEKRTLLDRVIKWPQAGIVLALIILYLILAFAPTPAKSTFFLPGNIINVVRQSAIMIVIGIPITFTLAAGLLDLSIGSLACLGAVVTCAFITGHSSSQMEICPQVPLGVAILIGMLVIYVTIAYIMYRKVLPLNSNAASAQNDLSGELSDAVTNILSVKTYGREDYEKGLFETANERVVCADSKRMRSSMTRGVLTAGVIVIIMVIVTIFISGGNAWFGISAGTLVMMFTYTYTLSMRFNEINSMMQRFNRIFGDAEAMTLILDEPRLVEDIPEAQPLSVTKGDIDFHNLDFRYFDAAADDEIFHDFSLHIPAGERVGLVGRSGSGKTTLTKLLLRLDDIQKGQILVDGQDIAKCTQQSLRRQIAYVPQEALLFHRTIRENIAYGRPNASDEEIRKASKEANALEFIEKLPHGFDTLVGERGIKLSGGQRQRVAIARAILADAPILVLDEATSALDSESEKLVQDALKNLMRNRTSIVVAHRLSTVAALDRIVVLSDGRIAEEGTHADLIEQDGEYAKLWNRQTGSFLEADEDAFHVNL